MNASGEKIPKPNKITKHSNVPIRPANLNNVIKQYVEFVYFE